MNSDTTEEKEPGKPQQQVLSLLQETIDAIKSYLEGIGFNPVINIKVENHYHGDIENYNSYE